MNILETLTAYLQINILSISLAPFQRYHPRLAFRPPPSMILATDAAHLLADLASFMISLLALYIASRRSTKR